MVFFAAVFLAGAFLAAAFLMAFFGAAFLTAFFAAFLVANGLPRCVVFVLLDEALLPAAFLGAVLPPRETVDLFAADFNVVFAAVFFAAVFLPANFKAAPLLPAFPAAFLGAIFLAADFLATAFFTGPLFCDGLLGDGLLGHRLTRTLGGSCLLQAGVAPFLARRRCGPVSSGRVGGVYGSTCVDGTAYMLASSP